MIVWLISKSQYSLRFKFPKLSNSSPISKLRSVFVRTYELVMNICCQHSSWGVTNTYYNSLKNLTQRLICQFTAISAWSEVLVFAAPHSINVEHKTHTEKLHETCCIVLSQSKSKFKSKVRVQSPKSEDLKWLYSAVPPTHHHKNFSQQPDIQLSWIWIVTKSSPTLI